MAGDGVLGTARHLQDPEQETSGDLFPEACCDRVEGPSSRTSLDEALRDITFNEVGANTTTCLTLSWASWSCGRTIDAINLLWKWNLELCHALEDWSKVSDRKEDIEQQVLRASSLVTALPDGHELQSQALCAMGVGLRTRFERLGNKKDLQDALDAHRQAAAICHAQGFICSVCLRTLGWCLQDFAVLDPSSTEDAGLGYLQESLRVGVEGSTNHTRSLIQTGRTLFMRYYLGRGTLTDVETCQSFLRKALEALSGSHPDRSTALHTLASASAIFYYQTGHLHHLDDAIQYSSGSVTLRLKRHPGRGDSLRLVCNLLMLRHGHLGNMDDLNRALNLSQESLDLTITAFDRMRAVQSHASVLRARHLVTGDMVDLEDAISLYRKALSLKELMHNTYTLGMLSNLAHGLTLLYMITGEPTLLTEIIGYFRQVLEEHTADDYLRSSSAMNLGIALAHQFEDLADNAALEEAILIFNLERIKKGGSHDAVLHHFARCLYHQHSCQPLSEGKLDGAIQYFEAALKLRPIGHPERHTTLLALADALTSRFKTRGDSEDILTVIKLREEVQCILPSGHPDRALVAFGQARQLLLKSSPYSDTCKAIHCLLDALRDVHCHPQIRLAQATSTLKILEGVLGHLEQEVSVATFESYRLAVALLPRVAFLGLNRRSKLRVLASANELGSFAAARAIQMGQIDAAIEILEEGRAVFWAQHLRLRTQFEALPDNLSRHLTAVANQLRLGAIEDLSPPSSKSDDATKAKVEADATRMRRLSEEFEMLIHKTRLQPGHEHFLMPLPFSNLMVVAEEHPVVVFLSSPLNCYAILLKGSADPGPPITLSLGGTSMAELQALAIAVRGTNARGRDALENRAMKTRPAVSAVAGLRTIWKKVMEPAIQALHWQVIDLQLHVLNRL